MICRLPKHDPSFSSMNENPPLESRLVFTQPPTVTLRRLSDGELLHTIYEAADLIHPR